METSPQGTPASGRGPILCFFLAFSSVALGGIKKLEQKVEKKRDMVWTSRCVGKRSHQWERMWKMEMPSVLTNAQVEMK